MTDEAPVMIIDDEEHLRVTLGQTLELAGYRPLPFPSAEQALATLDRDFSGVVISDIRMPGMDGMSLLREIRQRDPDLPVVLITGHGDVSTAVEAMREGAWDFLEKPFPGERLGEVVRRGVEKRRLSLENRFLKAELEAQQTAPGPRLVGRTPAIKRLSSMVQRISQVEADVLLFGETGAGKDLVARAIHERSARGGKPFVAINCGAVPESTIESELFGHEKGAFTGAVERRIGKFEHAAGGTVFLDEIESMPLALQVKLLRVLQERQVRPVGSTTSVPVDVRVLSATHRDLDQAMHEGEFREDLYYRLNVVNLKLPALKDRAEDVPLLVKHLVAQAASRHKPFVKGFSPEALNLLATCAWPGNVRQLVNVVEQCVALSSAPMIPEALVAQALAAEDNAMPTFNDARAGFERSYLVKVLKITEGNVTQAARIAGRNRTDFYKLLSRHELEPASFKPGVASPSR